MDELYKDHSIKDYVNILSSNEIVPGGGSAAALAASLAAGLNLMVINFSFKADTPEPLICELDKLKQSQENVKEKLIDLVDKDTFVFKDLMNAISLKEDTEEKFKKASLAPLEICRLCLDIINVTERILEIGNKNLICDTGCACSFAKAAVDSAGLNVLINLKYIKDKQFVEKIEEEVHDILHKVDGKSEYLSRQVNDHVRS